ncbi:MAG: DNA repair protein RecN [Chloracidobacterium sp.]|nr:DNA repair protein RecN [Chloracidobacterium sp.]
MLEYLKVKNIALIGELEAEFGPGLNLLTGETGSGKSIIVDSLGVLTGERASTDLIKAGEDLAIIEGLFRVRESRELSETLENIGAGSDGDGELIVRRELSRTGRNRIFINGQLATQAVLRQIGRHLIAIHGQGEHSELFDPASHRGLLDAFAGLAELVRQTEKAYRAWAEIKAELAALKADEADKLQLLDVLRFQIDEIEKAAVQPGESEELEIEKKRLANAEKLAALSLEAYSLLYDDENSTASTLQKATRNVEELAEFDARFADYTESIQAAAAVIEDLAITARDFGSHLEFSPQRLEEIENRLAEISRLTRKYGGSVDAVLQHLGESREGLEAIETSEFQEERLTAELERRRAAFIETAMKLHERRAAGAAKYAKSVEASLKEVALEKARFEVRVELRHGEGDDVFRPSGIDRVEFYFSANPGEPPMPLARVASGGEASRLMLVLKTAAREKTPGVTAVFDEIDAGIGGRVAESVGLKLKALAEGQQVLCVTHQPQVASMADTHLLVEKLMKKGSTEITVRVLDPGEQIEEIARMLAGETITDAARENAREMLAAAG